MTHRYPECSREFDPESPTTFSTAARRPARWPRRLLFAGAAWPIFVFIMYYVTQFAAWATLGHAPAHLINDPKSIGPVVNFLYHVTNAMTSAVPIAFCASFVGVIMHLGDHPRVTPKRALAIIVTTVVAWGIAFHLLRNAFDMASFVD